MVMIERILYRDCLATRVPEMPKAIANVKEGTRGPRGQVEERKYVMNHHEKSEDF